MKIITRTEAREAGLTLYFTGKPCVKAGHVSERYVSSANCKQCSLDCQDDRWTKKMGGVSLRRSDTPESVRERTGRPLVTKAQAKAAGLQRFFTGRPCANGHICERFLSGTCIDCHAERWERKKAAHTGPKKNAKKARAEARGAGLLTYEGQPCPNGHGTTKYVKSKLCVKCTKDQNARGSKKHKQARQKYQTEYQKKNKLKIQESGKKWRQANSGIIAANSKARKLLKIQRVPKWADKKAIAAIYKEAARLTKLTGIEHHVDHIVPLRSKFVSGLHWELNLQVIPASENLKKHNSYWPDMWTN